MNRMKRKKGVSVRFILIFLAIIFFITASAYYMESMKEKIRPFPLQIIPEITPNETTTSTIIPTETTILECVSNENCQVQMKCEGTIYYYKTGTCGSNNKCSYDDWVRGTCEQSKNYCKAECNIGDCPPGSECDINTCKCLEPGP